MKLMVELHEKFNLEKGERAREIEFALLYN